MNSQHTKRIFYECPLIYRKKDNGAETIVLSRGIECSDGWFELIHQMSLSIEGIARRLQNQGVPESELPHVSQVKEKFGDLRVYLNKSAAGVDEVLEGARRKAAQTCELCGETGKKQMTSSDWLIVLCDSCAEKI
jgi:hypothetical protein